MSLEEITESLNNLRIYPEFDDFKDDNRRQKLLGQLVVRFKEYKFEKDLIKLLEELDFPHENVLRKLRNEPPSVNNDLIVMHYLCTELFMKDEEENLNEKLKCESLRNILNILRCPSIEESFESDSELVNGNNVENFHLQTILDKIKCANDLKIFNKFIYDVSNLTKDEEKQLTTMNNAMRADYLLRRRMIIKRCEVTLEAFKWKEEKKEEKFVGLAAAIEKIKEKHFKDLNENPNISLNDLVGRTTDILDKDLLEEEKCESQGKKLKMFLNKDNPPDRGGRTEEMRPLEKESFSNQHQKNSRGLPSMNARRRSARGYHNHGQHQNDSQQSRDYQNALQEQQFYSAGSFRSSGGDFDRFGSSSGSNATYVDGQNFRGRGSRGSRRPRARRHNRL
ncbi:hypothetical protein SNEBB_007721 [Seison nebaliae]|nr:hypothetical protein SNEBB_007721 [Seison nebaliae]